MVDIRLQPIDEPRKQQHFSRQKSWNTTIDQGDILIFRKRRQVVATVSQLRIDDHDDLISGFEGPQGVYKIESVPPDTGKAVLDKSSVNDNSQTSFLPAMLPLQNAMLYRLDL